MLGLGGVRYRSGRAGRLAAWIPITRLTPRPTGRRSAPFSAEHLPPGWKGLGALDHEAARHFTGEWRQTLYENGLLAAAWPKEYGGGGLSPVEQVVLAEECYRAGVPTGGVNDTFSIQMVGNTLLHWGTEEQKRHFLPRILSGEDVWCQGYSEPAAGSDLANLGTRAVLDGDEWVINGQKIWTSAAQLANWIFVLARTDPDAPKHKGITFLLVPMDQPGVEVRPIRMMTGPVGVQRDLLHRRPHRSGQRGRRASTPDGPWR